MDLISVEKDTTKWASGEKECPWCSLAHFSMKFRLHVHFGTRGTEWDVKATEALVIRRSFFAGDAHFGDYKSSGWIRRSSGEVLTRKFI
jgi:hypothetical protein